MGKKVGVVGVNDAQLVYVFHSLALCVCFLCVMHAELPCHIKCRCCAAKKKKKKSWGKKCGKKNVEKKNEGKCKANTIGKAAPNQSQQYFSGLFQLACC